MTKTWVRVQSESRDVNELLDSAFQFSHAWSNDPAHDREGVSVCEDREELALYLASHLGAGIPVRSGGWVLVELEGDPIPGSRPIDPEFETLIRPTRIVSVEHVERNFLEMLDAAEAELKAMSYDPSQDWED